MKVFAPSNGLGAMLLIPVSRGSIDKSQCSSLMIQTRAEQLYYAEQYLIAMVHCGRVAGMSEVQHTSC